MSIASQVKQACRRNPFVWRYVLNAAPSWTHVMSRRSLSADTERVLRDLNRDGMAITSVAALGGARALFDELAQAVDDLERTKAHELDQARRAAEDTSTIGNKTFNVELLGPHPALDAQQVYCRFALDRAVLDVANGYFGMLTRLRYFNIWHTLATSNEARESQLWHRDREDFLILKVFVYLSDVTHEAGPFTYAPGTHPKGAFRREPAYTLEGRVRRSTDEQMAGVVPAAKWIEALGARGTVVFADTRGYHKGGLARGRDRLMYTCMFTSQASQSRELFDRRAPAPSAPDRAIAFAVGST